MKSSATPAFLCILIIQVGLEYSRAQPLTEDRIVNGQQEQLGKFPFQISLQLKGAHNCGGSIIDKNHVLTAAHCVKGMSPSTLQVVAGTVNLNNRQKGASTHKVTNIKVHEGYQEGDSWKNDIAIIKVSPAFEFSNSIAPAKLPQAGESYRDGMAVTVTGFGRTSPKSATSPVLLRTQVKVVNNDACQKAYGDETIRNTNVCAREPNRTTGFCPGDSGGPLSTEGKVIGIVSFSSYGGCANDQRNPQVYTRVSSYIDWIKNNMK